MTQVEREWGRAADLHVDSRFRFAEASQHVPSVCAAQANSDTDKRFRRCRLRRILITAPAARCQ